MATVDTQAPAEAAAPALPDYVTDPDAVLKDSQASWRYGRAPDYSKTRKVYADSKCSTTFPLLPEIDLFGLSHQSYCLYLASLAIIVA